MDSWSLQPRHSPSLYEKEKDGDFVLEEEDNDACGVHRDTWGVHRCALIVTNVIKDCAWASRARRERSRRAAHGMISHPIVIVFLSCLQLQHYTFYVAFSSSHHYDLI